MCLLNFSKILDWNAENILKKEKLPSGRVKKTQNYINI